VLSPPPEPLWVVVLLASLPGCSVRVWLILSEKLTGPTTTLSPGSCAEPTTRATVGGGAPRVTATPLRPWLHYSSSPSPAQSIPKIQGCCCCCGCVVSCSPGRCADPTTRAYKSMPLKQKPCCYAYTIPAAHKQATLNAAVLRCHGVVTCDLDCSPGRCADPTTRATVGGGAPGITAGPCCDPQTPAAHPMINP
jgi:hypothetical protein